MGFHSNKLDRKRWRDFLQANALLLHASGLPISLYESRKLFDDFLMHGYSGSTRFSVNGLSAVQREALVEVVVEYLRSGFADPGMSGLMGGDVGDEILRRAGQQA
jgi:hypothetical protein